jgi:hypothetical protein
MSENTCPICGLDDQEERELADQDDSVIACKRCGKYMMHSLMLVNFRSMHTHGSQSVGFTAEDMRLLPYLSAYTRQKSERGETEKLNSENWRDYAHKHSKTPAAKKKTMLLNFIAVNVEHIGHQIRFDCNLNYPLIDAYSPIECNNRLCDLENDGYIETILETRCSHTVSLTVKGEEYLEEKSRQASDAKDVDGVAVTARDEYISQERLAELIELRSQDFDLRRLIRLCEEIDTSYRNECWYAVAALTREVLDHVPPIFGQGTFEQVANNYGGGGQSFKRSMQHLQRSLRNIADAHLHTQIRRSESLPMESQVNFRQDLDFLMGEIVRILR